jgi:hypothetical protein
MAGEFVGRTETEGMGEGVGEAVVWFGFAGSGWGVVVDDPFFPHPELSIDRSARVKAAFPDIDNASAARRRIR